MDCGWVGELAARGEREGRESGYLPICAGVHASEAFKLYAA
jgi:hypothetical protein